MKKKQIVGIVVAVVLIAMYVGFKMYAANVAKKKIDTAISNIVNFADVDYKNVSVDLFGFDVHISDVVVSPVDSKEKFNINEIVISDIDQKSDIPSFLDISFNGVEIPIDKLGNDAKKIKELGYNDNILLNFTIEYHYNKESKEISLNKLKIGADDVGDLDVRLRLGNIDLSKEKIIGILSTFPQIMLYEAKISYHDDSLIEKFMKLLAKEKKENVKQLKNEAKKDIEREIEKENDEFTKNALEEIKDFIDDPETFTISIAPKKPLPLGLLLRVNDPKDIIKLLNAKIKS